MVGGEIIMGAGEIEMLFRGGGWAFRDGEWAVSHGSARGHGRFDGDFSAGRMDHLPPPP